MIDHDGIFAVIGMRKVSAIRAEMASGKPAYYLRLLRITVMRQLLNVVHQTVQLPLRKMGMKLVVNEQPA